MTAANISVILPIHNAEDKLPVLLAALKRQSIPAEEIIVIDSSSKDLTSIIAEENGCIVKVIPRETFRHGRTRNLGARLAHGEILVFLTKDALPVNEQFLYELTVPINNGLVAAAYARHIPNHDASPLEAFARRYNYPEEATTRSLQDLPSLGIKTFFFSDTASAYKSEIFWKLGGFRDDLITNEDMEICARLIKAGYKIAYQASAQVFHSHNYTLFQLFQRYFEIGVFFKQTSPAFEGISANPEGWRFLKEAAHSFRICRQPSLLGRLLVESTIKLAALRSGNFHHLIPKYFKKKFSSLPDFWY